MKIHMEPLKFVGRDEYLKLVKNCLETDSYPHDVKMLHFYGVGGVGKTTLRRELKKSVRDNQKLQAIVDFKNTQFHEMKETLFFLRNILKQSDKRLDFFHFDLAFAVYTKKLNPHTPFEANKSLAYLEETDFLANFIKDVWEITPLGWIPKATGFFLKYSGEISTWWKKMGNKLLTELVELDYDEIEERLIHFWAEDIRHFVAKTNETIVIFLDTLEKLTKTSDHSFDYVDHYWIDDLIQAAPEIFWLSFGRDKVSWVPENNQKQLGRLHDGEITEYLKHHQIFDHSIQDTMIETTKGHPYYLYLCVVTYKKLAGEKTPTPKDFEGDFEKVQKRFLAHLSPEEQKTLRILSVPNFWDQALYEYLASHFEKGLGFVPNHEICTYSFIGKTEDGSFEMHELMRESLRETLITENLKLYENIHEWLFEFYCDVLTEKGLVELDPASKKAILEAYDHGLKMKSFEDFSAGFLRLLNRFNTQPENFSFIKPLLYSMQDLFDLSNYEHRVIKFHNLFLLIFGLCSTYQLKEAKRLIEENEEILLALEGVVEPDFYSDLQYKHYNVKGGYDYITGNYISAETNICKAIEYHQKEDKSELIRSYVELVDVYRLNGKSREAKELLAELFHSNQFTLNDFSLKYSWGQMLKQGGILLEDEDRAEALKMMEQAYQLLEETVGEKHPNTLHALFYLADFTTPVRDSIKKHREVLELRKKYIGEHDASVAQSCYALGNLLMESNSIESRRFLEQSVKIGHLVYGEYDEEIAKTYRALGRLDKHKGHHKRALIQFLKAFEIYEKIKNNVSEEKFFGIYMDLGMAHYYLKEYDEAIIYYNAAEVIAEKYYGDQSSEYWQVLSNLGYCYRDDNKKGDSLPYFLKALEIEKTSDKCDSGYAVADAYFAIGDNPKAEKHIKDAIAYFAGKLGPNHLKTAVGYNNYGSFLSNQGKNAAAEVQFQKCISAIEANGKISKDNDYYDNVRAILDSMNIHFSRLAANKRNQQFLMRIHALIREL